MTRTANCACGSCQIEVGGDPVMNGICHCDNCRRRTGSVFGWSVYFDDDQVVARSGEVRTYAIRDEQVRSFCTRCGTTLFWTSSFMPGRVGIAGGAFVDPPLPQPDFTVLYANRVSWVTLPGHWPGVGPG